MNGSSQKCCKQLDQTIHFPYHSHSRSILMKFLIKHWKVCHKTVQPCYHGTSQQETEVHTHWGAICCNPLRYSCSKAGIKTCFLLNLLFSICNVATGVGSRHSGTNTMKDKGLSDWSSSFSKWSTIPSMSSSANGAFASNEPLTGKNWSIGLCKHKEQWMTLDRNWAVFRLLTLMQWVVHPLR